MLRNRIYYRLKPFVPRSLRTAVRRNFAQRLRHHVTDTWPIMPGSQVPPADWKGWPEGKQFAFVLTHDVETRIGLRKCRDLAAADRKYGFRSSFHFVPEGDYRVSSELRNELQRDGFEVGVHDLRHDGRLYWSRDEFRQNSEQINKYLEEWGASGFRSGFMLHNLNWLHDLRIQYDMSTFDTDPFEPQPDGRHTIFPFVVTPPPTAAGQGDGYVELPYTLPQDSTMFLLLEEKTTEIWFKKLDWVARHGGMVLLDTHPDYMAFDGRAPGSMEYKVELYEELLQYVAEKYAGQYWHALPQQVAAYVLENQKEETLEHSRSAPALTLNGSNGSAPIPRFKGKRAAVLLFSHYPADPRPRRAAEAMAKEGAEVDFFCLHESRDQLRHETVNGLNIYRIPLKRRRAGKLYYILQYSAFITACFFQLAYRSLRRRYDFVHVHNMPDVLVFSALIPKLLGAKVILDLHDPMPELMQTIFKLPEESFGVKALKEAEKKSIAFSDLVLTVNRACENIYSSRSCNREKIRVVLNSPDDSIFQFREPMHWNGHGRSSEQPYRILYHGSLVSRNGLDLAVDALELLRASLPEARLIICGASTPFFEEVMGSARARGLQDQIEVLGSRNIHGVVSAIENCDIGVIPNHKNIFTEINTPTRIFEYLSLGKPVISPRARGIQDYFGEDEMIYFTLGDAADLARQIEFSYRNPKLVEEIIRRGQRIYQEHTWTREKEGLLGAVSQLV